MEFLGHTPQDPSPKNLYQCLAAITIGQSGSRRSSFGGSGDKDKDKTDSTSTEESGGALGRIVSASRRKSSFGQTTRPAAPKPEATPSATATTTDAAAAPVPAAAPPDPTTAITGTWYWRVHVGVTDSNLVILPLSNPPNPLLIAPPPPLSQAMTDHAAPKSPTEGSITGKFKNVMRRASAGFIHKPDAPPPAHEAGIPESAVDTSTPATTTDTTAPAVEGAAPTVPEIKTTATEPVTVPPEVATAGARLVPREHSWPGVVDGQMLSAIVVPLHNVDKSKIVLGGGGKREASWVTVAVNSAVSGKMGSIKFEFDKDWLGAKAESELLQHNLETAINGLAPPEFQTFRLSGKPQGDAEYVENWQGNVRGKW